MKFQKLFLLLIPFINLSRCQNIISPTNYTLSYLENIDMHQMKCKFDSDCPQYSKCESVTDGDKTYSVCKFGDFLCPEVNGGYFKANSNVNESCVYVDATMYDLDEEVIREGFSKDIKPILKICGHTVNFKDCSTEKCNKNSDCFSGTCSNHSCINGENLNYEVYRCSVNDENQYSMKCRKANGIQCGEDSECFSDICSKRSEFKYCAKTSSTKSVLKIILIIIGILAEIYLLIALGYFIFSK